MVFGNNISQRKEEEVGFKGTRNASSKKERSNLEVLEAGLGEARFAIREAKVADENIAQEYADFVPKGPMYFNATAFLRYICVKNHTSFVFLSKSLLK